MRREAAQVGGDRSVGFANPNAGRPATRLVPDDPASNRWIHTVKIFQLRRILIDEAYLAVITAGLNLDPRMMECDIRTFATEQRFSHPTCARGFRESQDERARIGVI